MCSGCAWVSADYARRGKFGGGTKFHALTGFSLARPCSAKLEPRRIACVGNQWRGTNELLPEYFRVQLYLAK
jgi:hypothetical protein